MSAILAADIVGYTRLMEQAEETTLDRVLELVDLVVAPLVTENGGQIVKTTGDGVLAEFSSTRSALHCAVSLQSAVQKRNEAQDQLRGLSYRVGLNSGDVIHAGNDIFGDTVNVAARLEGLARPGGICVSESVHSQTFRTSGIRFRDLGLQRLKNVSSAIRAYEVVTDSGPVAAPAGDAVPFQNRPALAVLPLANIGDATKEDYLIEGLTQDLISLLVRCRSFPVIAYESTASYRGGQAAAARIRDELGARYALTGSVQRRGARIKLAFRLLDTLTDRYIWDEHYDAEIPNFFDLQEELAIRIAGAIVPELENAERVRAVALRRDSADVWDLVHRGMHAITTWTAEGNTAARDCFEMALARDAACSRAYAGLAFSHHRDLAGGYAIDAAKSLSLQLEYARKAVTLDRRDSFAYWLLAVGLMRSGRTEQAVNQAKRGIELNPSDAIAHIVLGTALTCSGDPARGIDSLERGLNLNPRDPQHAIYLAHLASAYLDTRDFEHARELAETASGLHATMLEAHAVVCAASAHMGDLGSAIRALAACERIQPGFAEAPDTWRPYYDPTPGTVLADGIGIATNAATTA